MSRWSGPPRRVPWRIALQSWAKVGTVAAVLMLVAVASLLAIWSSDDFRSPWDDWCLDAADRRDVVTGTVTGVDQRSAVGKRRGAGSRVRYTFVPTGGSAALDGSSWAARTQAQNGNDVLVEYLSAEPGVNRVVGTHVTRLALALPTFCGLLMLPSVLLGVLYAVRVHRMREVLRHGRATEAVLVALPQPPKTRHRRKSPHYRIRYRYRGSDGQDHEAHEYVRFHSALDRAVVATDVGAPFADAYAVHAELAPHRVRLVATAEFPAERS